MADCRVLTWNLWWRFGDWETRQPLLLDGVERAGADIVTVQECWQTSDEAQSTMLAEASGLSHVAWSPNRLSHRWRTRLTNAPDDLVVGLAILSRWPIIDTVEIELPPGSARPGGRTALAAIIDHPRGRLPVITTHLEAHPARSAVRVEQLNAVAEMVRDVVDEIGPGSLAPVVTGDMNAEPHSDEIRRFSGLQTAPHIEDQSFQDAWHVAAAEGDPGWTWRKDNPHIEAGNPNARIDYVFTAMTGRVAAVDLVGAGKDGKWPSDHVGVVADLRP